MLTFTMSMFRLALVILSSTSVFSMPQGPSSIAAGAIISSVSSALATSGTVTDVPAGATASSVPSGTCEAQAVLNRCLETTQTDFNNCKQTDYSCRCSKQQAITQCYAQCPNDGGVDNSKTLQQVYCQQASSAGSTTVISGTSTTSSGLSSTTGAMTTSSTSGMSFTQASTTSRSSGAAATAGVLSGARGELVGMGALFFAGIQLFV